MNATRIDPAPSASEAAAIVAALAVVAQPGTEATMNAAADHRNTNNDVRGWRFSLRDW